MPGNLPQQHKLECSIRHFPFEFSLEHFQAANTGHSSIVPPGVYRAALVLPFFPCVASMSGAMARESVQLG